MKDTATDFVTKHPRLTARVALIVALIALALVVGVDPVAADSSRNQPQAIY